MAHTMYDYGNCHICCERMEERHVRQEFWIKRKLVVVEDVPAGVCSRCGEKVVTAAVGHSIAALVQQAKNECPVPRRGKIE